MSSFCKKTDSFTLSHAQMRMFLLYKMEPGSSFYNINNILEVKGDFNIPIFQKALNSLIARHDVLRTNFKEIDGKQIQIIRKKNHLRIKVYSIEGENNKLNIKNKVIADRRKETVSKIIKKYTKNPFRLESGSLIRVAVIKLSSDRCLLIASIHHIVLDSLSMNLFGRELMEIYNAYLYGREPNMPKLETNYKDYVRWENSKENKKNLKKQEKFWLKEFSGELPMINLPIDKSRLAFQTYNSGRERIVIDKKTLRSLKKLAKQNRVSLYILLFTIFNVFLYKITEQCDIVVGTSGDSLQYKKIENNIGLFANILVIRSKIKQRMTLKELLFSAKNNFSKVYNNQDYPFGYLVKKLNKTENSNRNPLFDVFFQMSQPSDGEIHEVKGAKIDFKFSSENITKSDMFMKFIETSNNIIILNCEYNTDLFEKATITRFLHIMAVLIDNLIKDPNIKISELEIVNKEEKHQLIYEFNNTKADYPKNKTIHQLFEEQVERTPNNIAVEFEGQKLSYEELNKRANQLAHYLRDEKRVKKGSIVGLFFSSSIEAIISMLAIFKVGAAYLPIDINFPAQRIAHILDETKCRVIISSEAFYKIIPSTSKNQVLKIDAEYSEIINKKTENLSPIGSSLDLAIVIYTSGSTAIPKGVMLVHRSLVNSISNKEKSEKFSENIRREDTVILQTAPIGYIVSVQQIFAPIILGARIVIASKKTLFNGQEFCDLLIRKKINMLVLTPIYFKFIEDFLLENKKLLKLKYIILGGELVKKEDLKNYDKFSAISFFNVYGFTEGSTHSLYKEILSSDDNLVGRPISNTQAFILNKNQQLQPIGMPGELYISGVGLATGYVSGKKRTNEVFLKHPFMKGETIYKTGDLAKMHDDRNIEILGRVDYQIKISGQRVEPGEIEMNIKKFADIKDCIVVARPSEKEGRKLVDNHPVAYYTTKSMLPIDSNKLKESLKNVLPYFMMPVYFVHLKSIPLNQNGKVNRFALPIPLEKDINNDKYQISRIKTIAELSAIWQDVLNIEKIGPEESFFNLGGNSLQAVEIYNRIEQIYPNKISIAQFFSQVTISGLAHVINDKKNSKINPVKDSEYVKKEIELIFKKLEKDKISPEEASELMKAV